MLCTENSKKEPMKTGLPTEETVQRWLIKAEKDMAIYCLKQAGEMGSEEAKRYLRNLGYQFY